MNRLDLVALLVKHGAWIPQTLELNYHHLTEQLDWIENKIQYIEAEKRDELLKDREDFRTYRSSTFILMNYAFGVEFESLDFLKEIDISGMNFVGASFKGIPITHNMLKDLGLKGAENAITSIQEMPNITTSSLTHSDLSTSRLIHAFTKHGGTMMRNRELLI